MRTRDLVPRLVMILGLALTTGLASLLTGPARAYTPDCIGHRLLDPGGGEPDVVAPGSNATPTRADTVWFGGDDGLGVAVEGGVWDFETPGSNGVQGWISEDLTENPGVYFGWVEPDSFGAHGDPCVPMISGSVGMLWCGIHEDEADRRDFVAGMGYQNAMCQWAVSPSLAIDPLLDAIDLSFTYFNHTEPAYDYTHIEVLCYDALGELLEVYPLDALDGVIGSHDAPAVYGITGPEIAAETLDPATTAIALRFVMKSDGGWSDEDGLWETPCGPFGVDDLEITIGASVHSYDFDDGPQGWTFDRCPGQGAYMAVHEELVWYDWLVQAGVACECRLSGGALGFVDTEGSPYSPPGLVPGQKEAAGTGVVTHGTLPPLQWNTTVVVYDAFTHLPQSTGAHYRPGWRVYPYTTETNPVPHWSSRHGMNTWYYTSSPYCQRARTNLSQMDDDPLPVEWDSMRFVYEVYCSCDAFSTPPSVCTEEGATFGSPILDNVRIGLTHVADAPPIGWVDGGSFADGFGQLYPTYLDPSDRCNANINFPHGYEPGNICMGDSSVVGGPLVQSEAGRWLCELCFQVTRKGARQDWIPEYHEWKARLGQDPEEGYVCALMDSLQTYGMVWKHKFATYFHEEDPRFDPGAPDYSEAQEIVPDLVFTPGTRIEYYYRSFWYNGGAPPTEYFMFPVMEFELLPTMTSVPGSPFEVQWPCVLCIDSYNRGADAAIGATLGALGLAYDQYDNIGSAGCWNSPIARTHGGTFGCNVGGYGNNGWTTEQMLGYRVVFLCTGTMGIGNMEDEDFDMFADWLTRTDCGLADIRRAFIFDGDGVGGLLADPVQGKAIAMSHDLLGLEFVDVNYRDFNSDDAYCVYLEPATEAVFSPTSPGIALFGNGCPQEFDYDVLGVRSGVEGAVGNLRYYSYQGTGTNTYVDYAQVVRANIQPGVANMMTVVGGFSLHHLSARGCGGLDCGNDSSCVVTGALALYGPLLDWMQDPGDPFGQWRYPCVDTGVEGEPETHLSGPGTHLYAARPNPFHRSAAIRFRLARAQRVQLDLYDVGGRRVRTLLDGPREAGEHNLTWDGTDDEGRRLGAGIFWMQMRTGEGYISSRKMLLMR